MTTTKTVTIGTVDCFKNGIEAITVFSPSAAGPWTLLPLQLSGNSVTIQWTGPTGGLLESAPSVLGPWTSVPNQTEFLTVKPRTTATAEFFRVRSN